MNAFMNFIKKFLVDRKTRGEIEAMGGVKALLLSTFNLFTRL